MSGLVRLVAALGFAVACTVGVCAIHRHKTDENDENETNANSVKLTEVEVDGKTYFVSEEFTIELGDDN